MTEPHVTEDPETGAPGGGKGRRRVTVLWTVLAAALAAAILVLTFRNLDIARLARVLGHANWPWVVLLLAAFPAEQMLRGWKWRQILHDIKPVGTLRLFGAVMAGYFANMVVPVGISPLVRAWIVARTEALRFMTVLMTTAVERFVDGVVFATLIGILLVFAALPGGEDRLRMALIAAGMGSLALFATLLWGLFFAKGRLGKPDSRLKRWIARLETAFGGRFSGLGDGIAAGIVWPASRRRGVAVVGASIMMKMVAMTYFLWAGLSVGILLAPFDYLFLLVVAGFSLIVARFVRIPGGFVIGSSLALKLLDVPDEEALTMVVMVHSGTVVMVVTVGAIALWRSGITLGALRHGLGHHGQERGDG